MAIELVDVAGRDALPRVAAVLLTDQTADFPRFLAGLGSRLSVPATAEPIMRT